MKLHTLLDPRGNIPTFLRIRDGKLHAQVDGAGIQEQTVSFRSTPKGSDHKAGE